MNDKTWGVYLARCSDNSLYCGVSNDIKSRLIAHNSGKGARYTRSRRPVDLVGISSEMTKSDPSILSGGYSLPSALQFRAKIKSDRGDYDSALADIDDAIDYIETYEKTEELLALKDRLIALKAGTKVWKFKATGNFDGLLGSDIQRRWISQR